MILGLAERVALIRSRRRAMRDIGASGLFDAGFYADRHAGAGVTAGAALSHYLRTGMAQGLQPSAAFDPALYLALNPDVAASGEPPLLHYIRHGRAEGRPRPDARAALAAEIAASGLFDPAFYVRHHPEAAAAPLDHYVDEGLTRGMRPSAAFDPALYLALNPDVAADGEAPLLHYIRHGRAEGRPRPDARAALAAEIAASGLFDPEFYVRHHPEAAAAPLDHYVDEGLTRGMRPSAAFDPALYLALNPDVAADGEAPLLHYIRHGRVEGRETTEGRAAAGAGVAPEARLRREIAASGLFDPDFYAAEHPQTGTTAETALSHYLRVGMAQHLQPSLDFNPILYLKLNPDVAAEGPPPLLHYIRSGRAEGRPFPDGFAALALGLDASNLFDPEFYVALYPDVARSGADPLGHFLEHGAREGRRPSAEFDGAAYLAAHPDVAAAGKAPLLHYILHGRAEGRALPPTLDRAALRLAREEIAASGLFDADFYVSRNPMVRERGVDPILHYLVEGAGSHLDPSPRFSALAYAARQPGFVVRGNPLLRFLREDLPAGESIPKHQDLRRDAASWPLGGNATTARMATMAYFSRYGFKLESSGPTAHIADAVAALAAGRPEGLTISDAPDVSIVIPVYGQMPFVATCLDSLQHHDSRFSVEIIVADDASPAEQRTRLLGAVPWIRYHRNGENLGFLDNCNAAVAAARGRFIVLLNSDTRVLDGWLDELIGSFDLFPKAGFVGSKLLNADGTLQEAGGVYWSDGTAWNYGRGQDPDDPRYNFARRVDWVSGASIAVPMQVWREVNGFDVAYRPAYCEDVDLAFRIRERGYEVWYQPLSCVLHFEGKTHGTDETRGIKAYQVRNLKRLQRTWAGRLPGTRPGGFEAAREANRLSSRRMLVVDANIHMPDRDAGSVVASQMMEIYRQLGYDQMFAPLLGFVYNRKYIEAYQRRGVEVAYAPFVTSINALLERDNSFDYVLAYRYVVAEAIMDSVRRAMPLARIIFSNVDLHFLREEREAALKADRSLKISASRAETQELAVFTQVDCSIVHTPDEAAVVDTRLTQPVSNIVVFPWVAKVVRDTPDRAARRDLMFLGGFPHQPNVDAMVFFMEEVWPRLVGQLPQDARFLIVGNAPPNRVRAFASERVVVTGHVPEVGPYLAKARVFIAPLRYGAGIKGKVIDSLSHGVPTIATHVAVEGIPVVDGREFLLADSAEAIADAVMRLYDDIDLWDRLRLAGFRFIVENYSLDSAIKLCEMSLDVADATWMAREKHHRQVLLESSDLPFRKVGGS